VIEGEVVARFADWDGRTAPQSFVNVSGTASAAAILQDTKHIPVLFMSSVAKRIAAHQPVREMYIDVRARGEFGELFSRLRDQFNT